MLATNSVMLNSVEAQNRVGHLTCDDAHRTAASGKARALWPWLHGCPPDLGVPYQGQLLCPWVYEQGPLSRFYCGRAVCSVCGVEC